MVQTGLEIFKKVFSIKTIIFKSQKNFKKFFLSIAPFCPMASLKFLGRCMLKNFKYMVQNGLEKFKKVFFY